MTTLIATLLLLQTGLAVPCTSAREELRAAVRSVHEKQANIGLTYAVWHRGSIVITEGMGFADRARQIPAGPETVYGIASVTKPFTGLALLQLAERGRIDLDAPIQRYLPDFPVKGRETITARLLAAHYSGIRHWANERTDEVYGRHFARAADVLPLFAADSLINIPGTTYAYSSHNYNVIAALVEAVAGRPFPEYVRDEILRPLELGHTDFENPREPPANRSERYSYYDLTDFRELEQPVLVPRWDYTHNMGGGGLVSTAGDLVRFGRVFLKPGFVSRWALDQVTRRPQIGGKESSMAFGWFVSPDSVASKRLNTSGSNAGVQAGLYVHPEEDLVAVVLSNSWGKGSRSGEMVFLPGVLGSICLGKRS